MQIFLKPQHPQLLSNVLSNITVHLNKLYCYWLYFTLVEEAMAVSEEKESHQSLHSYEFSKLRCSPARQNKFPGGRVA